MLFVMSCSGPKHEASSAAMLKYDARQHRTALDGFFGETGQDGFFAAGHDYAILSAEHGFIPCTYPIANYDRKMTSARAAEFIADSSQFDAFSNLAANHALVVVYGGADYRRVVVEFCGRLGIECQELVGDGRGCGDHYSALQSLIAESDEDA